MLKISSEHSFKCGMITHLAKETRQQKSVWGERGGGLHKLGGVRNPLPTNH